LTPTPAEHERRNLSDESVAGKDEPRTGTSPDPRVPYGPDQGPPVGEAAGEDSETKPPTP
jgi:hypothetical protein